MDPTPDFGIVSFGAYIPRTRLQRKAIAAANGWFNAGLRGLAKGERAIGNWDEDAITMGVEAARECLAGADRAALGSVVLASTTLPFDDRQNSGVLSNALNLASTVRTMDTTGSLRAAATALAAALAFRARRRAAGTAENPRKTSPESGGCESTDPLPP